MKFNKPRLPYAADALSPVISEMTIEYHYGKHEQAYIDNLNKLIADTEYADMPIEEIIQQSNGKLFENASQAWNHIFYFLQFSPTPQEMPSGELLEAIEHDFGSFEQFKNLFEEAGSTIFGSGWVWLSKDDVGRLFITQGRNADNPIRNGLKPILTFDIWEHAYYLDYQNRRTEYLKNIWKIIDWDVIEIRYLQ
jgi:Fe-Mn family superoxide dismutase